LIKIRLQRKGRIRRPIYHIVVADSRAPRDGRIIEQVGRYDGVTEKKETVLNEDRILYWLETGAQPTDSVRKILRQEGLLYKHHLMMWGKSEEEITVALSEWKAYRDSKKEEEVTHRDQVKAALASEEKEYKTQVTKQATATVKEAAEEAPAEEPAVEEAVEEASAEEPAAEAKTSTDMSAKDAAKYIAATDLANLDGFVTEAEERKTVLAALEAKKAE
jgi:small subunit ribosomal protein S16